MERFVSWFLGTFGFAFLPLLFQWIHRSNKMHSYNLAAMLGSAEGWLFCLIVSTAIFLEETQESARRSGDSIIQILCVLVAVIVSFEYSDMVYSLNTPVSNDPYWIGSEGVAILVVAGFAVIIKATHNWRPLKVGNVITPTRHA